VTHVQSVPTLSLLDSVKFDNVTEEWSFAYETMSLSSDDHGQLNQYYRILYLTHSSHDIGASDTANNCLLPGTDYNHSEVAPARARERRDIRAIAAAAFGMVKANATSFLRERASRAKKGGSNGGGHDAGPVRCFAGFPSGGTEAPARCRHKNKETSPSFAPPMVPWVYGSCGQTKSPSR